MPYNDFKNNELPQHTNLGTGYKRLFMKVQVKSTTYFPQLIIAIRSPSKSASSMKWVVRMMVRPGLYLISKSQMARRE